MEFSIDLVRRAYLSLKTNVYHENYNLFIKQRVADFECGNFEASLEQVAKVLSAGNPLETPEMQEWLNRISFHVLPKAVQKPGCQGKADDDARPLFLTNVAVADSYDVKSVNYLIDAPIELHIIDTLWCALLGSRLEPSVSEDCYSNRLDENAITEITDGTKGRGFGGNDIFKRYFDQYKLWRDKAIACAQEIWDRQENVALLSIDLKAFFYHVQLDWEGLAEALMLNADEGSSSTIDKLNPVLRAIHARYRERLSDHLAISHAECADKEGLPIGLSSSGILANYHLRKFDDDIHDKVRPAYYGRYVDDIIIVFRRPKIEKYDGIKEFVERYLPGVIHECRDRSHYFVRADGNNELPIQPDKLILQFFDKDHSKAGLDLFLEELKERSSAFQFLSDDAFESELDKFAYDVLYEGSVHRPRSIVGIADNETELARYLTAHITAHRLNDSGKSDTVLPQLQNFFRGVNVLRRPRLWEKVYQYAFILGKPDFIWDFYRTVSDVIEHTELGLGDESSALQGKLKDDLASYNNVSISLCLGLLDVSKFKPGIAIPQNVENLLEQLGKLNLNEVVTASEWDDADLKPLQKVAVFLRLQEKVWNLRDANLIRHGLICWPLLNFTDYAGTLVCTKTLLRKLPEFNLELSDHKLGLSPRFIHFDEWQIFRLLPDLATADGKPLNEWFDSSLESYKDKAQFKSFPVTQRPENGFSNGISVSTIKVGSKEKPRNLTLGVANMQVCESDIAAGVRQDKKPNLSRERQKNLYSILDQSLRDEKADIVVMPEVSIPVSWLPFMVSYARRNEVALVFGLEHWVVKDVAYNLLIEALPFKTNDKYKSCAVTARLKVHYAPAELKLLKSLRLTPAIDLPNIKGSAKYHRVRWRGVSFASYNCFELSDMKHRALFKSKIDLMLAPVFNRDTNYYQRILESAVRDVHCYVVQSNSSIYGGSCVLQPAKTEKQTLLFVKGGINPVLLKTKLDIKSLRKFQHQSDPLEGDSFKHLPPGYDSAEVAKR